MAVEGGGSGSGETHPDKDQLLLCLGVIPDTASSSGPKEESYMMSRILTWLIVSMLSLTGIGMAAPNDETEPRTVVRAMMTAYLDQDVESFSQHVVSSVEGYDDDARFGARGFDPDQLRHAFASGFKPPVQIRQVHARVFGKTASVTVEMDGSLTEIPDKTRPSPWRLTQLWSKKPANGSSRAIMDFPYCPAGSMLKRP
jgi:hypothetical protein